MGPFPLDFAEVSKTSLYSMAYIDLNSKIEYYMNIWQLMEWPSGYWRNMTLLYCKLINSRVGLSIFHSPPFWDWDVGRMAIHSPPTRGDADRNISYS